MKIYQRLLIIVVVLGLVFLINAKIHFKILRINCMVHDPKTIQNLNCLSRPINRTTTFVSINGYVIRNVSNLIIKSQLYKKAEIMFRPFLVNTTDNYCDFFSKNKGGAYLRLVAPLYLPYTNANHSCPYSGYIFIKDLPIDQSKLPQVWPTGVFRLDTLLLEKDYGELFTIHLHFEVKESRVF